MRLSFFIFVVASLHSTLMGSDLSALASSVQISSGSEHGRMFFNGREYRGRNLQVTNGKVFVDGKSVEELESGIKYSPLTIKIEGNVEGDINIPMAEKIEITGDLRGSVKTQSGNVHAGGSILQDAKTMSGNVVAGGAIHGRASTMSGNVYAGLKRPVPPAAPLRERHREPPAPPAVAALPAAPSRKRPREEDKDAEDPSSKRARNV